MEPLKNPRPRDFLETIKSKVKQSRFFWHKEQPKPTIGTSADNALSNAAALFKAASFDLTAAGISMFNDRGGYISLAPLGLPMTIGGFVIDVAKLPFFIGGSIEEGLRGGLLKIASLFEKSGAEQEKDRIYKSFLLRMNWTANILITLGLATTKDLSEKLKSGDISELVGLTLLHTAYDSLNEFSDTLALASGKLLVRDDCPVIGLSVFDKIIELKKAIKDGLALASYKSSYGEERELEEAKVVCQWITSIKTGKLLANADKTDASPAQIAAANKIIQLMHEVQQLGMDLLPHKPEVVAKKIGRF